MSFTQPVVIYCEFTVLLYTHVYVTISANTPQEEKISAFWVCMFLL